MLAIFVSSEHEQDGSSFHGYRYDYYIKMSQTHNILLLTSERNDVQ